MSRTSYVGHVLGCSILIGLAAPACRSRIDELRRDATAEAERQAGEATLTSIVVEAGGAAPATDDVADAFRREQQEYRDLLRAELDAIEDQHGRRRPRDVARRREVLARHLRAIDRSTHHDWATLRAKIDRDVSSARK